MANTTLTVTADMTIQTLIDAGISLAQIQSLVNAKQRGASTSSTSDRAAFAEEIYALMIERPTAEWKNGTLLKNWFPNGKEQDADLEKLRVKKHQMISRALADLASDGRLTKERSGQSASTTFYKVVESRIPAQADEADAGASDDIIELIEEAERIEFEDAQDVADYIADLEI